MSTPRVGSLSSSTFGSVASQRAITTFCWLPPDSVVIGVLGIAELDPQAVDVLLHARARARVGQQPAAPVALKRRDAEVLADRLGLEERLGAALARDVGDVLADRRSERQEPS